MDTKSIQSDDCSAGGMTEKDTRYEAGPQGGVQRITAGHVCNVEHSESRSRTCSHKVNGVFQ